MTPDRSGLRRKLWLAFAQAAAIALAAGLSVFAASAVIKHVLIQRALNDEASHYWQLRSAHPDTPAPNTFNMTGYLVPAAGPREALPPELRALAPGYHSLSREQGGSLVLVERRGEHDLILLFKQEQVDALAFWFGTVPLAAVLLGIYGIAWLTYRASKRAVSPVIWLAAQVRRWDPVRPDVASLRPEALPGDIEGETLVLAQSLHQLGERMGQFVERERNFTRDASHELRTPLAVIRVAGDLMDSDQNLSPMSRRALARIRRAGLDMEALIEAFLILAREADQGLPDDDFRISEVIADEIERAGEWLLDKPVELRLEAQADFGLHAPARVLSVLLGNLLRNACKYTERGTVTVRVLERRIEIADTGVGMSADELAKVFEPFYRAGNQAQPGHGIGLSIVRRLADRYGWRVLLQSQPGQGTTASIDFPETAAQRPQ